MKKNKTTICQRCGAKIEGVVDVCPYCGAKIVKPPFYKKKWFIILVAVLAIALLLSMCNGGNSGNKTETADSEYDTVVEWPDSEIGNLLPETDAKARSISIDSEYIYAYVQMTKDEYKDYVDKCKENGFTVDESSSDDGEYCYYDAKNKDGYELSLRWDKESSECSISLSAPEEKSEEEAKKKSKKKSSKKESSSETASSDGVTPEFKEAMDEYEEFFDEYVEVMKNYSEDPVGYLADYTKFLAQYSETMEKLDEIDEDSLSAADSAYYLEVMGRINQKLAEVQ